MHRNKCDIMNLEWTSDGRDTHIVEPVLVSLEKRFGYKIIRTSIWSSIIKLLWYRPKAILVSNDIGADVNVNVFHFANKMGIKTISLTSEGLVQNTSTDETDKEIAEFFFWGDNLKHEKYYDLKILWSEVLRDKFRRWIPMDCLKNVCVCGATGFDRYKLFSSDEQDGLRQSICGKRTKIVMLVGYPFDEVFALMKSEKIGKDFFSKPYAQLKSVRAIYEEIIRNNQDIQFVLKYHPAVVNEEISEFYGLNSYENVITYKRDMEISKLIDVADIIVGFETTVAMEAWLKEKLTVFVNPLGTDFDRQEIYKGLIVVNSVKDLQRIISDYFDGVNNAEYISKTNIRKEILKNAIQHDDGLNYLRTSKTINDYMIGDTVKKKNMHIKDVVEVLGEIVYESVIALIEKSPIGYLAPKHRLYYRKRSANYNASDRAAITQRYVEAIDDYETKHALEVRDIIENYKCIRCDD